MIHLLIFLAVLFGLIAILYISVVLGRWFGIKQVQNHPAHQLEVMTVAEGSVFALLGLLIAFTFSGAYDRYETRKLHIIAEANSFEKVFDYLEFVTPQHRKILHSKVSQYLDAQLNAFEHMPFMHEVDQYLNAALKLEDEIVDLTKQVIKDFPNPSLTPYYFEAIENMFDTSHYGINLARVHPPIIIFLLMIGLAALGGFLIGYDAAESKQKRHIHIVSYILLTAITINIIINLEYPRTGFIRLNTFDQILTDVRDHNNESFDDMLILT